MMLRQYKEVTIMDKNTVKNFYSNGLWNIILVKTAVRKGVITKEETIL